MRRTGPLLAIVLSIMMIVPACGKGGGTSDKPSTAAIPEKRPPIDRPTTPGREAVPEPRDLGEAEPGIMLVPMFDPAKETTTLAVAPGDRFEVYVCAKHPQRNMASATYQLKVPEGIEILGEGKLYERSLTLGTYSQYFVVTYPCHPGDEYYPVLRYSCMATPAFKGGEFRTEQAVPLNSDTEPPFLGFVSCGDSPDMTPANAGSAELTLK